MYCSLKTTNVIFSNANVVVINIVGTVAQSATIAPIANVKGA
jgi:hypothetical protein